MILSSVVRRPPVLGGFDGYEDKNPMHIIVNTWYCHPQHATSRWHSIQLTPTTVNSDSGSSSEHGAEGVLVGSGLSASSLEQSNLQVSLQCLL